MELARYTFLFILLTTPFSSISASIEELKKQEIANYIQLLDDATDDTLVGVAGKITRSGLTDVASF